MRRLGSFAEEYYTGAGDYPDPAAPSGTGYGDALPTYGEYVGDLPVDASAGDLSTWERFAQAAQRFQAAWSEFSALPIDESDELYPEYAALYSRASVAANTMQTIADGAGAAWEWAKRTVGLSGARSAVRRAQIAGLGVAPLLSYAAITGAIALLIAVGNSLAAFVVKYRRRQMVFEENVERAKRGERPISVPGAEEETTTFQDAAGLAKWIVAALVVFYAAPTVIKAMEKRA